MSNQISASKAKKILEDGEVKGKPLTSKQRKYLAAVAYGEARDENTEKELGLGGFLKDNLSGIGRTAGFALGSLIAGPAGAAVGTKLGGMAGSLGEEAFDAQEDAEEKRDKVEKLKKEKERLENLRSIGMNTGVVREEGGPLNTFKGPTHEEGGINLKGNEVEGGETSVEDYVFSDKLKVPGSKVTFAQKSKRIRNKYNLREDDPYSEKEMKRELSSLQKEQEAVRRKQYQKKTEDLQTNYPDLLKEDVNTGLEVAQQENTERTKPVKDESIPSREKKLEDGGFMDFVTRNSGNLMNIGRGLINEYVGDNDLDVEQSKLEGEDYSIGYNRVVPKKLNPSYAIGESQKMGAELNEQIKRGATSRGQFLENAQEGYQSKMDQIGKIISEYDTKNVAAENQAQRANQQAALRASQYNSRVKQSSDQFNSQLDLKKQQEDFDRSQLFEGQVQKGLTGIDEYLRNEDTIENQKEWEKKMANTLAGSGWEYIDGEITWVGSGENLREEEKSTTEKSSSSEKVESNSENSSSDQVNSLGLSWNGRPQTALGLVSQKSEPNEDVIRPAITSRSLGSNEVTRLKKVLRKANEGLKLNMGEKQKLNIILKKVDKGIELTSDENTLLQSLLSAMNF